jgi:hypothetical protein
MGFSARTGSGRFCYPVLCLFDLLGRLDFAAELVDRRPCPAVGRADDELERWFVDGEVGVSRLELRGPGPSSRR